jgi:two-component system OmpR family response regulator
MRILVAEDDRGTAFDLKTDLSAEGHEVVIARDGEEALEIIRAQIFDAMVLDIMMPKLDGFEVLTQMRAEHNETPVIILSALSTYDDRVKGLGVGADDYLTKPFGVEELLARLGNITRRHEKDHRDEVILDDLTIDLHAHEVTRNGDALVLRPREFKLLTIMAQARGRIFTKDQLHKRVWGYDFDPQTNLVRVTIARLREQIDRDRESPLIETIHGVGYRVRKD